MIDLQEAAARGTTKEPRPTRRRYGVRVRRTHLGRGVFAARAFDADILIADLEGRIIEGEDYRSDYCIDLGGAYSLEPERPFRFLNHACRPNCELICVETDNEAGASIQLISIREIVPGEELTIDYAWPADSAIECGCGLPECRGWIVAAEELHLVAAR